jgi:hypothetical protein
VVVLINFHSVFISLQFVLIIVIVLVGRSLFDFLVFLLILGNFMFPGGILIGATFTLLFGLGCKEQVNHLRDFTVEDFTGYEGISIENGLVICSNYI